MNAFDFSLSGNRLRALGSGALWWPGGNLLCVSDLHLGKSERLARRGGVVLPPYDIRDTLDRLSDDLSRTGAATVVCLGDSFDDLAASQALPETERMRIAAMQAGRRWIWIEGNHDPGPTGLGGSHLAEFDAGGMRFRHVAGGGTAAEVSGHYHPKARVAIRGRSLARPAFLVDSARVVMPAYGTYTGGLFSHDPALSALMEPRAIAILTGPTPRAVPMPR